MVDNYIESSLDFSWIDEEEMLLQYQSFLQPSPLESIQVYCILLDVSNQIIKVDRFMQSLDIDLENLVSSLSAESFERIYSKYMRETIHENLDKSYTHVIDDILLYNVDITTEQLQGQMNLIESANKYMKSLGGIGSGSGSTRPDIVIAPSLSIFHCIQCLIIFIKQVAPPKLVKSILKKGGLGLGHSTKRVRIHPETFKNSFTQHKTRRERG